MKYLPLLLLLSFGCSKKAALPEENNEEPVFYFTGKIDGEQRAFQAGNDGYYMYSSYNQHVDGIYQYQGELRPESGNGSLSLTIKINDSKISAQNAPMNPDDALHTGPYLIRNQSLYPKTQRVSFIPQRDYKFETFEWEIKPEPDSLYSIASYSTVQQLLLNKTYTVVLKYDDNVGSCQTAHQNIFRAGNPFHATVTAVPGAAANSFNFKAVTEQSTVFTYFWEFGDGTNSNESEPTHVYPDDQVRTVKLTLVNDKKDSCVVYHQASVKNNYLCHANFNAAFQPLDMSMVLKTIVFEMKDASGKIYSSAEAQQPSGTFAEVVAVSDYINNRNNERTRKLDINFNCVLKGPDKDIRISDGRAVIAVSYR